MAQEIGTVLDLENNRNFRPELSIDPESGLHSSLIASHRFENGERIEVLINTETRQGKRIVKIFFYEYLDENDHPKTTSNLLLDLLEIDKETPNNGNIVLSGEEFLIEIKYEVNRKENKFIVKEMKVVRTQRPTK